MLCRCSQIFHTSHIHLEFKSEFNISSFIPTINTMLWDFGLVELLQVFCVFCFVCFFFWCVFLKSYWIFWSCQIFSYWHNYVDTCKLVWRIKAWRWLNSNNWLVTYYEDLCINWTLKFKFSLFQDLWQKAKTMFLNTYNFV